MMHTKMRNVLFEVSNQDKFFKLHKQPSCIFKKYTTFSVLFLRKCPHLHFLLMWAILKMALTSIHPPIFFLRKPLFYYCIQFYPLPVYYTFILCYPPASEASREVANLTERKNPHTPAYGVKEFVCLSVINFNPIIYNTLRIILTIICRPEDLRPGPFSIHLVLNTGETGDIYIREI